METCHWCGCVVCAKDVETRKGNNFCDADCAQRYENDVAEGDGSDA